MHEAEHDVDAHPVVSACSDLPGMGCPCGRCTSVGWTTVALSRKFRNRGGTDLRGHLHVTRFAIVAALAALTTACSAPAAPTAGDASSAPTSLVLASGQELGGYNPVRGYAELGVSPLYDGLMRLHSEGDQRLPELRPALAAQEPQPDEQLTTWRVKVREGITFHDGTSLGPEDVVATYRTILDPASGSDIASSLDMVSTVAADGDEIVFTLKYPYTDFPSRLLVGIAPSEALTAGKAEDSPLNTRPIGTGPYRLAELTPDRAVFEAVPSYWGGAAPVTRLTTVYLPDDNTRAQRMSAGEIDGTALPPLLAETFAGRDGVRLDAAYSADWRGISFPRDSAFAQEPAARLAMNLAVDRDAIVERVLGGHGRAAATPVAPVYGEAYDPEAVFPFDPGRAGQLLDEAGWGVGPDGVRAKGEQPARFTVAYNPSDTLRRDLATAFAADMKKIGVDVRLEGLDFAALASRMADYGILLGGGDKPYSLDTQVFGALHSPVPGSSQWDNPGGYSTPSLDAALEAGRRTSDHADRVQAYRSVQQKYLADPSHVFLVFLRHTYVSRSDSWQRGPLIVEPHAHGVDWGPWWNLQSWRA